ncbi:hypothetical protein MKEN_01043900 [Mycena kentingensis (nom. inval.)]|nr:hypothetical protein MKEN_01043900 [Mycena kentingensis (nom. inval.)]
MNNLPFHECDLDWIPNEKSRPKPSASPPTVELPNELLIEIFSIAVLESAALSRALALTSNWVAKTTRPLRLRRIVLRTFNDIAAFTAFTRALPESAQFVRGLWVVTDANNVAEARSIPKLLRACTKLRSLTCQIYALRELCRKNHNLRPVRLTLTDSVVRVGHQTGFASGNLWPAVLETPHAPALLAHITHLSLTQHHGSLEEFFPIAAFPALTHLAMRAQPVSAFLWIPEDAEQIRVFARAARRFRLVSAVLVFLPPLRQSREELWRIAREEGVLVYSPAVLDGYRELQVWKRSVDEEDIWELARRPTHASR